MEKKSATAKKTISSKKKEIGREDIIALYMDHVLLHEKKPKSVYKFTKAHNITEKTFYHFFGSFDTLQKQIWTTFFDHSIQLAHQNPEYTSFSNKEKMLTFLYTFFELLTANRSYVLFTLQEHNDMLKNIKQLKGLRTQVKEFASTLIEEQNEQTSVTFLKHPRSIFSEGAWLQTLFILKYWMSDSSSSFEKTDVVIEKSVRAIFDVFNTAPLESVLDFGKFLWKDKMN